MKAFARHRKKHLRFDFSMLPILNTNSQLNCVTNFTYIHTPWPRAVLQKLNASQLVKKLPIFCSTRRFHSALSARHVPLSWTRSVQPVIPWSTSSRIVLILSSHPRMDFQNGLFPTVFHTITRMHLSSPPIRAICPAISFFSILYLESTRTPHVVFLYSLVTLSLLGPNILLGTPFSNTLSPCSSLDVSNHSHPYKTTSRILILTSP
jgi:hypothetical protein